MSTPLEKVKICEKKIDMINIELQKGFTMKNEKERKDYLRPLYQKRRFWMDEFYTWFEKSNKN